MKKINKIIVGILLIIILFVCGSCSSKSAEPVYQSEKTQIKIFTNDYNNSLENVVNEWLSTNKVDVISLQMVYETTSDSHFPRYKILIYYRNK